LLLHQLEDTRRQWDAYIQGLLDEGYRVLAIDLRSHGESDDATVDRGALVAERDQALLDVEAAFEWFAGDEGTDPEHLGVIGTGLGGSLAIAAAHAGFGADLTVAVSARETNVTALAGEELANLSLRGLFVVASEEESGGEQATSANDLYEQSTPPRKLRVLPGSASGSDLVAAGDVWFDILDFLQLEL
jgi:pimeloyl-ACP methyl ester carboxylesterase